MPEEPTPETPNVLQSLRKQVDHFEGRRARARERLSAEPQQRWSFAFVGLRTDVQHFRFIDFGDFRVVTEPPGEVELAGALKNKTAFGAVGRYSHWITHELSLDPLDEERLQSGFDAAWYAISALRIKTLADFLVPVSASRSWSVIAGVPDTSCDIRFIEDVPRAQRLESSRVVETKDLEWAQVNLLKLARIGQNPRVRLAIEAITTHTHLHSERMMAASVWAGIEALLDVKAELRYRLSLLAACILEPRGPSRIACYRRMKKMYDVRSKAVHGTEMEGSVLREHVLEARLALSGVLCRMIEAEQVFSEEQLEEMLLGNL